MLDAPRDPTPREVRVFGLLWLLFFAALGGMTLWRPAGLLSAAVVLTAAWLVSLAFHLGDWRRQIGGVLLPALMAGPVLAVRGGVPPGVVVGALAGLGVAGAVVTWAAPAVGKRLFLGWTGAALPIGWTISHAVLAIVYYVVITPIGFVLRLTGYDPMRLGFDRGARTYWIERKSHRDPRRYLRQF
jgi:hypothetical protein